MLKSDLKDSDIPGRTTLHKRIDETLKQHLDSLAAELQVCYVYFIKPF
jgi:hypothetical protein